MAEAMRFHDSHEDGTRVLAGSYLKMHQARKGLIPSGAKARNLSGSEQRG
jgi:hypothetical protein